MDANMSPGTIAIVQTVTSRYRKVARNFRFAIIATSVLDRPRAHLRAPFHRSVHDLRLRCLTLRHTATSQYWQKLQSKVSTAVARVMEGDVADRF